MKILWGDNPFLGVSKQTFKYLGIVLGAILSGWILAGIFVSLISLLFDLVNFTMSWYANPWIIFGLYCFPTVAITALSFIVLNTYFTQVSEFLLKCNKYSVQYLSS